MLEGAGGCWRVLDGAVVHAGREEQPPVQEELPRSQAHLKARELRGLPPEKINPISKNTSRSPWHYSLGSSSLLLKMYNRLLDPRGSEWKKNKCTLTLWEGAA